MKAANFETVSHVVPTVADDDLSIRILQLPGDAPHWQLVMRFLELRKQVFVNDMKWQLFHDEGIEFEQYDTIGTIYIIAHRGEKVVGGARLKRTDCLIGHGKYVYTYMIRDACYDLLPGMPNNLCYDEPPVDHDIWELTRFTVSGEPGVAPEILKRTNAYLHGLQGKACLFLGPPAFMRMAKKLGFMPEPLGPISGNEDGRFLAFKCAVIPPELVP
ncbi:acyl-homoserine-lactone synthase [Paracoccus laeviglucosivorans]|uniref:Acyl homoserine lactone synthase n=1 Tax=Paracoccus laeviglucosivorans TaxID=1197861 RepID=A0A521FC69_9RHOB|nr:acyl-homoserine-lactone synthase [Paracoccus laeviglucosivorans]SMO93763.1 acyl homoserine lactone synthase [Paracoccus laeviglucosivorans]